MPAIETSLPARTMRWLGVLSVVLLQACASIPEEHFREASSTFAAPATTRLGASVAPAAAAHPGTSGFHLLDSGREGLQTRVALAGLAEHSIDAQYFIWNRDTAGKILGAALIDAANRGVRVRVLVDDFYIGGRDERIAALNRHENIHIRVFNPVATRRSGLTRAIGFISNFARLNHRMHNKLFLVDGAMGVAGGRNVGDEYYGLHDKFNMRDRDVLAAGPVVAALGDSFDKFWNSGWSIPFAVVSQTKPTQQDQDEVVASVQQIREQLTSLPYRLEFTDAAVHAAIEKLVPRLIWATAQVHFDDPEQPNDGDEGNESGFANVRNALTSLLATARQRIMIQTPYLVPKSAGVAKLGELVDKGVAVTISTNSLASTDVVPAQAIYSNHRPGMLAGGARIFELRPDAGIRVRYGSPKHFPEATLGLHAKTIVVDDKALYVGTYNLDQRSAVLNTEIALVIYSAELAKAVARDIERDISPENSWEVVPGNDGEMVWLEQDGEFTVRHNAPPQADLGRRAGASFLALLPLDSQL
jgi:putative cardiolipin synthase